LYHILLLKRDQDDPVIVRELTKKEALDYLVERDFCNPHQLVRDDRKFRLRKAFFSELLSKTDVRLVNTRLPPEQTQLEIRRSIGLAEN
jgi:hypothetical protein